MKDFKAFKKMKHFTQRYLFGRKVGQGMFGKVCECKLIATKKSFCVKIMSKEQIKKNQIYEELLFNELQILSEKSHPNIIRVVDLIEDDENYYVVSELVKGGQLLKRLVRMKSFSEADVVDIVFQVMLGLNYFH